MIEKDKLYSIWVYLQAEPLFWLTLTIGSYLVGDYLYKKSKLFPLVNPVAISILIISLVLINLDISYERYFDGAKFIHFMLGPATVALAIPIYKQFKLIQKEALCISVSLVIGSLFAIISTFALCEIFKIDDQVLFNWRNPIANCNHNNFNWNYGCILWNFCFRFFKIKRYVSTWFWTWTCIAWNWNCTSDE